MSVKEMTGGVDGGDGGGGNGFFEKRGGKEDKDGVVWFSASWLRKRERATSASMERDLEMVWFDGVGGGGAGVLPQRPEVEEAMEVESGGGALRKYMFPLVDCIG